MTHSNKSKKPPARVRKPPPPLLKLGRSSISSAEDTTEIALSASPTNSESTIASPENHPPTGLISSGESHMEEQLLEPAIQVALIPMSLLDKRELKGRIVRSRVVAFFEDGDEMLDPSKNAEAVFVSGVFEPPVLCVNGAQVPCVISIPSPAQDRRLVRGGSGESDELAARIKDDEFIEGLNFYSDADHVIDEIHRRKNYKVGYPSNAPVPQVLVQFCKATSLASSATPNERLTWDQVSMCVAIRAKPISSRVAKWLDVIMGFVALAIVAYHWQVVCDWIDEQITVEERTLKERVEAVMSKHAPLGFKLNPQADFVLGNVVILVVDAWQHLIIYPALYTKEILIAFCIFAAVLNKGWGLSVLFAVAFDAFAVIVTHVGVLHRVISRILRFQLGLLGSLGLLMRGKKRNVLRHRVDTLRTDSAQLMIGTMAIFFFFFTLQTTLAYHLLVLAVWALIFAVQSTLFVICVILRSLPLDDLYLAYLDSKHSNVMGAYRPRNFHLVLDEETRIWRLTVVPVSMANILSDWVGSIGTVWTRAWSKRWGSHRVLIKVLFGHELPSVPPPVV